MTIWNQDLFIQAWNFASLAHGEQKVPGRPLPYINHVGLVAMEVMAAIALTPGVADPDLAVQCALLHDVVEDTPTPLAEVERLFGPRVAAGVAALSKDPALPSKAAQMRDSLKRIRQQPPEVWMVKLADRICNLQPPPHYWDAGKIRQYRQEASQIHDALHAANAPLATRLLIKIEEYRRFEGTA